MTKSLVQQQFGAHAAAYATSPVHAKGASLGRLLELVEPQPSWQALDIATGAGHTAAAFAPHVAHVIASDITEEMLAEARKLESAKGLGNMEAAFADAEALPFEDARFELVTCRIAAHHFPDVARFVAEVRRVLKPGGTFALVDNISPDVVSTPGFSETELCEAAVVYNAFEKLRDPSHGRCLSVTEWGEVITAAGLGVLHREVLGKSIELAPWAARMAADTATTERLRATLEEGSPALKAFLKPRVDGDALWFNLDEAIVIARKQVSDPPGLTPARHPG
jgi:SAM-dependent methyltransferase